jgi:NAD(P)-dependent dehydrogenase (short-subunit alcohol dehydrogenase family)
MCERCMTLPLSDSEATAAERRVVAITAAGAGIGREAALGFAAEGAALALNDVDEVALRAVADDAKAIGVDVVTWAGDIGDPSAPGRLVRAAVDAFGRIDVLHNNAGFARHSLVAELTDEDWYAQQRVVLDAVVFGTRAALPHMIEQGRGCIVNTASISGLAGRSGMSAYSACKAAVVRFTEVTALENARHGVRCVAVAPGAVRTAVLDRYLESIGATAEEFAGNILGRLTEPSEVAEVVVWLASDRAGAITGVTIPVNQTASRQ